MLLKNAAGPGGAGKLPRFVVRTVFCAMLVCCLPQAGPADDGDTDWTLESKSIDEVFRPYLGNGYMGVKVAGQGTNGNGTEQSPHQHFVAGVWLKGTSVATSASIRREKTSATPIWSQIDLYNGESYFSDRAYVREYRQIQNLRQGYVRTTGTWRNDSRDIDLDILFIMSRSNPHLGVIRYSVVPRFSGTIRFETRIEGNNLCYTAYVSDRVCGNLHEIGRGSDPEQNMIWLHTKTNLDVQIGNALVTRFSGADASYSYRDSTRRVRQILSFKAEKGRRYTLDTYATVFTSHDSSDPDKAAREEVVRSASRGWEDAFRKHVAKWKQIWDTDVIVEGEDVAEDQRSIRAAIFNLVQSMPEQGDYIGLGPSGLSDGFYWGYMYWDADYWTWTPMAFLHRDLARPLLDFRYRTRAEAGKYAASENREGYKWPWMSSGLTGKEMSPTFLKEEVIISGCVSLAHWNYYLLTRDKEWLKQRGYPVMKGTAEYWKSRVDWNAARKRFEVHRMVPPLEQGIKDNGAATASLIRRNLLDTTKAAELVGDTPDPQWREIAEKIWIPFDDERQVFKQYEGYDGHKIDQSAASLMIFPVEYPMPDAIKRNMMDYYVPRLNGDQPVVSYATFGVVQSELRRKDAAWALYREHLAKGTRGAFQTWIEHTKRPTWNFFLQSAGSYLQHVIFGFAGIRIRDDGILVRPSLPKTWKSLRMRGIKIGKGVYEIAIDGNDVPRVRLVGGIADVNIYDETRQSLIGALTGAASSGIAPTRPCSGEGDISSER